jgi:ZIP family zinc transporter
MPVTATHVAVIFLSLLSCVTTALGVALALALRENARALATGIGFSTGIMLLIALVELLPESVTALGLGGALVGAGLGAPLIWAAALVIPHTHLVPERRRGIDPARTTSTSLIVFGLILHDVPEGFAMANAYIASPAFGVLIGVAIALHNLPEEFAMAVPAVTSAAAGSSSAPPSSPLCRADRRDPRARGRGHRPALNAAFLAFAAGAMLFVSIHELIPMARRYQDTARFVAGLGLAALVYGLLARAILASRAP